MNRTSNIQPVQGMIQAIEAWVKTLANQASTLDAATLEQRIRTEGIEQLASLTEALMQAKIDAADDPRRCVCGGRLHHGGQRSREVLSSMGPLRLHGAYRRCRTCRRITHAVDGISRQWLSVPMRELITTLGVSMASFAKAQRVCKQVLCVSVSTQTVCRTTEAAGRTLETTPAACEPVEVGARVTGSCDGTSVNTRQRGWRELKAYLFEHGQASQRVRLSDATLEPTDVFFPRIRQAAITLKAGAAERLFFVADAAAWIDEGLRTNLPTATRIIDIYHAYQHVHDAAKGLFADDESKASAWANTWCDQLRLEGGRVVWDRLRRTRWRYKSGAPPRIALEQLLGYLDRHGDHLNYPSYIRRNWPISSGPMESTCKQLGLRLKGPGMRWNHHNVTPMARLLCRWFDDRPLTQAA